MLAVILNTDKDSAPAWAGRVFWLCVGIWAGVLLNMNADLGGSPGVAVACLCPELANPRSSLGNDSSWLAALRGVLADRVTSAGGMLAG
jgi:hypothetical protein